MKWIHINERLPMESETIDGRVPILDSEGDLRWGLMISNAGKNPSLISDTDVEYWCVPPKRPKKYDFKV